MSDRAATRTALAAPAGRAGPPDLDVIIVNYNAGDLLVDAVLSGLRGSLRVRVIVSDNGSTDGSVETLTRRLAGEPALSVLENGANLGFAGANNKALALTSAPYVLLLNPDCVVAPHALGRMIQFMDATPSAGMSGCVIRNPDGSEQRASRRRLPDPWNAAIELLRLGSLWPRLTTDRRLDLTGQPLPTEPTEVEAVSGSLMLVRRAALDSVGPLDDGYFLHCEDLDWFVRFRQQGWRIYFLPDAEAVHHQGSCSRSAPTRVEWHKHRGMTRFYCKFQANAHAWPLNAFVILGIWVHFAAVALFQNAKRLTGRLHR